MPNPTLDLTDPATFAAARRFVDTSFGRIAWVENGDGPAAVFLHGLPLNGFHWRNQLTDLVDLRRCIAIDLMGLGHTEVDANQDLRFSAQANMVLEVLDAMDVDRFDLVGSDSGGGVAQIVAAKAPQRIRSLTLTNSDVHDNWPPDAIGGAHEAATNGVLDDLFASYLASPESARAPGSLASMAFESADHVSDELLELYLSPILETDERRELVNRFLASQDNSQTVEIEPQLRSLQAPTLILWGTGDVFFPVSWAHWLHDTIPGAREVVELHGAKLFFAEERPHEVNHAIRRLWSSLEE